MRQPTQDAPPIVVALDFRDLDSALELVDLLGAQACWYKVGCQLFARYGRRAVDELIARSCKVFVDLKVNGHPKTDYALGRSIAAWRVGLVDIHVALGKESISRFLEGLGHAESRPKVVGVTVLTSHANVLHFGVNESRRDIVLRLASIARESGLDGVVAAASDVRDIKDHLGKDFLVVTPGIRPSGSPTYEQRQVATPAEATRAGANYLVVGRPVTAAPDREKALKSILDEVAGTVSASSPLGCEQVGASSQMSMHAVSH